VSKKISFLTIISLLSLLLAACTASATESPVTESPATVAAVATDETAAQVEPDLAAAAEQLGVTEEALKEALGDPSQGAPDFGAAAEALGVTTEALENALGATAPSGTVEATTVTLNGIDFEIAYELFTWSDLPSDVTYELQPVQSYTSADGTTHWYEAVYVESGNLNWYQAANLAQDAGGYLASITGEDENSFVFDLVSDEKYFWCFDEDGEHYGICIGPFLGGYQPEGSEEPDGGWSWLSGEEWDYANWAVNLDDGVIDQDPRDNTQPNDSGDEVGSQPIMGFGEMNVPVATWGDYMENVGTYGETRLPGLSYGFVIEYEADPAGSEADSTPTDMDIASTEAAAATYRLVDTGQGICYNADGESIDCPAEGEAVYGQDAQFTGNQPSYTDNGDGTVTDNVTGLIWQQTPDSGNYSWDQAQTYCESLSLAGRDDWRMPSLKELFSISNFSTGWPYLDQTYFDLASTAGISKDEQYWASDYYVGQTAEGGYDAAFGVNHATGHIKAYPALVTGPMAKHVRCVCGDEYGVNDLQDNGDGTITDQATGLMWMQDDSGEGMDWEQALAWAQEKNAENYLGYSDWRLPDVKEMQSIVDYSYAPDASDPANEGPAIDPLFNVSTITNEAGDADYPYFWTSTSARFQAGGDFYYAWYVAFGRAVNGEGVDFHGAGAVRFDTKVEGGPAGEGDERVYNYVRLVRGGNVTETPDGDPTADDTVASVESADSAPSAPPAGQPSDPNGQPPTGNEPPSGNRPSGPGGKELDLATAAAQLNVTEEALQAALGDPSQGQPDFAAAAQALGVSEADLLAALGMSADGQPQRPDGGQPLARQGADGGQQPDFAAAAAQLGVTEEALQAALGDPSQGQPDFAAAAQTLGVSEADLLAALGMPADGQPPTGGQRPGGGKPPTNRP